jgi:hypothetical protein
MFAVHACPMASLVLILTIQRGTFHEHDEVGRRDDQENATRGKQPDKIPSKICHALPAVGLKLCGQWLHRMAS